MPDGSETAVQEIQKGDGVGRYIKSVGDQAWGANGRFLSLVRAAGGWLGAETDTDDGVDGGADGEGRSEEGDVDADAEAST